MCDNMGTSLPESIVTGRGTTHGPEKIKIQKNGCGRGKSIKKKGCRRILVRGRNINISSQSH